MENLEDGQETNFIEFMWNGTEVSLKPFSDFPQFSRNNNQFEDRNYRKLKNLQGKKFQFKFEPLNWVAKVKWAFNTKYWIDGKVSFFFDGPVPKTFQ